MVQTFAISNAKNYLFKGRKIKSRYHHTRKDKRIEILEFVAINQVL